MVVKKILITGVSGLLGGNLAWYFRDRYIVNGWYCTNPIQIDGLVSERVDILDAEAVDSALRKFKPDVVIHCASLANVDACERHPEKAQRIHVDGTKNLVDALRGSGAKFIYISTDSVYEGLKGPYREDAGLNPQNVYGKTKLEGEQVASGYENSLILRTNLFGWNIQNKKSLAEWVLSQLQAGETINGFQDARFSCIYTFDLARLIELAIKKNLIGLYNCSTSTPCSKYDFACNLAEIFGLDERLVRPALIADAALSAPRGHDLSMDVGLFERAIGMSAPTTDACLTSFFRDFSLALPKKIRSSQTEGASTAFRISYGRHDIAATDVAAVVDVLESSYLTQGPKVELFEKALCDVVHARYATAVNSGTAALHIACLAAGVGSGDEVITSPITFVASANCTAYCGATPVFCDIDPDTYNLDPKRLAEALTEKTRAVIPVHFAGQSCDMEAIHKVVRDAGKRFGRRIYIIEDASHALGSEYKGAPVGGCQWSDMATMSFHPVKHITTAEGGVVFTNSDDLLLRLKRFRSHGITSAPEEMRQKNPEPWCYEQQMLGYNYRMSDLQSALGISQLKRLPEFMHRRMEIVDRYNMAFRSLKHVVTPFDSVDCLSNRHLYVLLFDFAAIGKTRVDVMKELKDRGIGTQVHYIPVHTQPYYQETFGTAWGDYPQAELYYKKCLSIPLYPKMKDTDVDAVICAVKEVAG